MKDFLFIFFCKTPHQKCAKLRIKSVQNSAFRVENNDKNGYNNDVGGAI